jgi:ABC-type multidrug transport system fused ATPase/permease subunit
LYLLRRLLITAGNSLRGDSIKNFILAMIGIWFFVLSPMFLPVEIPPFIDTESLTTRSSDTVFIKIMLYLIAAVLCGFQLQVLLRTLIPSLKNSKSRFLSFLFTKGMVRETFLLKQAVSLKTHNMVKNALDLHFDGGRYSNMKNNQSRSSTNALALLNYSKSTEKTEEVGGILWCWKGYVTRSVIHREGVMVNSRLVLANILQFFLVIILCFWLPNLMVTTMFPIIFPAAMEHEVKSCDQSTFNPDDCYFITLGGIPAGMAVCYNVQVVSASKSQFFLDIFCDLYDSFIL